MRSELQRWVDEYPRKPGYRDSTFEGSPIASFVRDDLPKAIAAVTERPGRFQFAGSAGKGDWTHTPWVAIMDPIVTTSVESGYYVVYLLSLGCERLYLSLNQGCTALRKAVGDKQAKEELARRASAMRARVDKSTLRLTPIEMDLNAPGWRASLYQAGLVLGRTYNTSVLPSDTDMEADLEECLSIYQTITATGGWEMIESIVQDASDHGIGEALIQAKRYRQHRSIERQAGHSKKVKAIHGHRCQGCDFEMQEIYGEVAEGMIEAHHLVPLSSLDEGVVVTFDPRTDFAVLCPNCHRAIHRLNESSNLERLRELISSGRLSKGHT